MVMAGTVEATIAGRLEPSVGELTVVSIPEPDAAVSCSRLNSCGLVRRSHSLYSSSGRS